MRLKTEHVARLLGQPCEAIRAMVRTGAVSWGVYIKPKSARYGRGKYVYYPAAFAKAAGLTMEEVEAAVGAAAFGFVGGWICGVGLALWAYWTLGV